MMITQERKKTLLKKYPDLLSFTKLEFNSKSKFKEFVKTKTSFLKEIFSIVKIIPHNTSFKEYIDRLTDASNSKLTFFLMYRGEELVGVINGFKDKRLSSRFYISHLAIKEKYQKKGFGRTLKARACAELNKSRYLEVEDVPLSGAEKISLQLTGNLKFQNEKLRQFNGNVKYELPRHPRASIIAIKRIPKPHVK